MKLQVDKNLRFMILMDGVHPEMDTCIIVEYKGTVQPSSAVADEPGSWGADHYGPRAGSPCPHFFLPSVRRAHGTRPLS